MTGRAYVHGKSADTSLAEIHGENVFGGRKEFISICYYLFSINEWMGGFSSVGAQMGAVKITIAGTQD